MGCDIHAHFEIKIAGRWEHYTTPDIGRNYKLFERMAGVRGDPREAIASPRGLPSELSAVTKLDVERWFGDAHSCSWLSAAEIAGLSEWGRTNLSSRQPDSLGRWDMEWDWHCYLFGNSFAGFTKYRDEIPPEIEDLRLVFWFDN